MMTSRTTLPCGSMVTIMSQCLKDSALPSEATVLSHSFAAFCTFSVSMSYTTTWKPFLGRFEAMEYPALPSPMYPTVLTALGAFGVAIVVS